MELFLHAETWVALLTLTFLEIVLGIDNIIFLSLLTNKLPKDIRGRARFAGIGLALVFRIAMLLGITWIIGFTQPIFSVFDFEATGRDIVLFIGGLFLIGKSTSEIHHKVNEIEEHKKDSEHFKHVKKNFLSIIIQIGLIDIVFSFDSILTAIGMTPYVIIMIIAVIISLFIMLIFAGKIGDFIEKQPTLQILALSFLILIGFMLIADAAHYDVPKAYIYFAVAFSLIVELINMKLRKKMDKK
jgi:predicted tellurium resistance membrane protein TerC